MIRSTVTVDHAGLAIQPSSEEPVLGWAAYNGASSGSDYHINLATTSDFVRWKKVRRIISAGSGWEDKLVKDAHLVKITGGNYYLFYAGQDTATTTFQIGLATSSDGVTWTKHPLNPILTVGGAGAWDEDHVAFPFVIFDSTAEVAKRWKMWFHGASVAAPDRDKVGYAYSSDGVTWTKYASNPVLDVGGGGAIDDEGCGAPSVYRTSASDWTMFYEARPSLANPQGSTIARVTFSDPEGTYTKHGTVLSPATGLQNLTANTAAGSTTVTVTSSAGFSVGEPVLLRDSTQAYQETVVDATPTGTTITIKEPAVRAWTTANTASVRSGYYGTLSPKMAILLNGSYVMFATAYQQFGGSPFHERAIAATASSLSGSWSFDYNRGLMLPLDLEDLRSAENPSVLVL